MSCSTAPAPLSRGSQEDAWLPLKDAARRAQCHVRTVRRAIARGELAAVQRGGAAGRRWFVRRGELDRWAFPEPRLTQPSRSERAMNHPTSTRSPDPRLPGAPAVGSTDGLIGETFDAASVEAFGRSRRGGSKAAKA